jgi:hypothetical protein
MTVTLAIMLLIAIPVMDFAWHDVSNHSRIDRHHGDRCQLYENPTLKPGAFSSNPLLDVERLPCIETLGYLPLVPQKIFVPPRSSAFYF